MDTDTHARLNALETRVERAAREARLWRRACAVLLVGAVGAFGLALSPAGSGVSDILKARALHIVSEEGETLVQLSSDADGGAIFVNNAAGASVFETYAGQDQRGILYVSSETGAEHVGLSVTERGGSVFLRSADDAEGVSIDIDEAGAGRLRVQGESEMTSVEMGVDSEGGVVRVYNALGAEVVEVFADEELRGLVAVHGEVSGQRGAILSSDADGGMLSLYNRDGKLSAWAYNSSEGYGQLAFYDQHEAQRVFIGCDEEGGSLFLMNTNDVPVTGVFVDEAGRGILTARAEDGRDRAWIGVDDDGGTFFLTNTRDLPVIEGYASTEGEGLMILSDPGANARLEFIAGPETGIVNFWGKEGGVDPERSLRGDDTPAPQAAGAESTDAAE